MAVATYFSDDDELGARPRVLHEMTDAAWRRTRRETVASAVSQSDFRFTQQMRIAATVWDVNELTVDHVLEELADFAVPILRQAYDINAGRHDALVGDDAVTFGGLMYRNSWFQLEQAAAVVDGWTTARPEGSLLMQRGRYRVHVYRHANDETVDVDEYRLDAADSNTKISIANANRDQLSLDLEYGDGSAAEAHQADLDHLVVIHSGNPEDGCCGIWVGAPVTTASGTASPWAWIRSLWQIQRAPAAASATPVIEQVRHDELPEPDLDIQFADDVEPNADEA